MKNCVLWMMCAVMCMGALACGGKQKGEDAEDVKEVSTTLPPREEVKEEPKGVNLTLGAFRLYEADNPAQAIEMTADGGVVIGGAEVARVYTDGRVMRGEELLVTLKEDGSIMMASGDVFPVTLDANGHASSPDLPESLFFAEDGSISGQNESAPKMASEGCQGDVARTCMLVLLVSAMPVEVSTTPGPTSP